MAKKTNKKVTVRSFKHKATETIKVKMLLVGTGIGLIIGGLIFVILTLMHNSQVVQDTPNYHPATYSIAEKFICGCPDCKMELVTCKCDQSTGGIYELYYISERLKERLTEEQVIKEVYNKFGSIEEQYRYLIER